MEIKRTREEQYPCGGKQHTGSIAERFQSMQPRVLSSAGSEHPAHNGAVIGSNPIGPTLDKRNNTNNIFGMGGAKEGSGVQ